jgi:hypothetical protein
LPTSTLSDFFAASVLLSASAKVLSRAALIESRAFETIGVDWTTSAWA